MNFPCIALLTDFGERDGFVGVMRGVIYSLIQSPVPVLDISHGIAPQDIRHGIWVLENAFPYYPARSVFVCVVDPGVGTREQASLLCWWPQRQQVFLAPDNGLLTPILDAAGEQLQMYHIQNSDFYRQTAATRSQTFHGRDVYAPVAAQAVNALLDNAMTAFLSGFGPPVGQAVRLERRAPERLIVEGQTRLTGEVVHVDIFGNLITNIPSAWLTPGQSLTIRAEGMDSIPAQSASAYAESHLGTDALGVIPSSGGALEISLFRGSAQQQLGVQAGTAIVLELGPV